MKKINQSWVLLTVFSVLTLVVITAFLPFAPKKIQLAKGAHISMIGGNLGSRMLNYGFFDTELHLRFPTLCGENGRSKKADFGAVLVRQGPGFENSVSFQGRLGSQLANPSRAGLAVHGRLPVCGHGQERSTGESRGGVDSEELHAGREPRHETIRPVLLLPHLRQGDGCAG